MTKILFDNQIFKIQKFGGVSRYFAELMHGLKNKAGFQCYPSTFYSQNRHLRTNKLTQWNQLSDSPNFRGKLRLVRYVENKEEKKLIAKAEAGSFDIFHPTYYNSILLSHVPKGKPIVLTVYDMIHELYYDPFFNTIHGETMMKRKLIPQADHIVAISQNTKDDILRFFPGVREDKISVVHLGSSFQPEDVTGPETLNRDYILFVGNRGLYKNFEWMLQALAPMLIKTSIRLVCAGGGGTFNESQRSLISNLGVGKLVSYLPVGNDQDLIAAYRGAACFIFPSLFEGFGIPILEAFACGCPVVLPNSSCFPEIAGDAALYFDQMSSDNLTTQVLKVYYDKELSAQLKMAGYQRLKLFSWEKTIEQHINLYKSLA